MVALRDVIVLLHEVEGPINLGSVMRIMANTGFSCLRFSGPLQGDELDVRRFALNARDGLVSAQKCDDLDRLLQGTDVVIGFSARQPWADHSQLDMTALLDTVHSARAQGLTVGLLFGNEARGLSNDDLARCTHRIFFPTAAAFPSVNLSHAVLLALWPIYQSTRADSEQAPPPDLINHDQRRQLVNKLLDFVDAMAFTEKPIPEGLRHEFEVMIHHGDWTTRQWQLWMALFNKAASRYRAMTKKLETRPT